MSRTLLERITAGETHIVLEYLEAGHAPQARDDQGVSLLQWCAYYGDVCALKLLIRRGESLHALGENFDLLGAAFHGYPNLVQYLIEQGADVNRPATDTGETPLHAALCSTERKTRDPVLQILLANGANPNCRTKPAVETDAFMRDVRTRAETPLHRAAAYGTEETIQMLLDAGASVDARDMHGDSPLTWASWHLRPRSILRLLCFGQFRA